MAIVQLHAPMALFDSHAHLDDPAIAPADLLAMLPALQGWLGAAIAGYGPERHAASRALCLGSPCLVRAVGLHPGWLAEQDPSAREAGWQALLAEIDTQGVVAVGEIGLDRRERERFSLDDQRFWFERGLRLAAAHGLPVVLHVVGWHGHALELLRRVGVAQGGVVHRYSGPAELVPAFEALGLHLGFALEPREHPERRAAVVRAVADGRIVVETDWPFLSHGYAEAVTEMGRLVERLAAWRGEDAVVFAQRLADNAAALYRLAPAAAGQVRPPR